LFAERFGHGSGERIVFIVTKLALLISCIYLIERIRYVRLWICLCRSCKFEIVG